VFELRGRERVKGDMRPKGSAEELERRRRRAVELLEKGERPCEVVRRIGCSKSSLFEWREKAKQGPDGLRAIPSPGRRRRMTPSQDRRLERTLKKGAKFNGWSDDLWTVKRVAVVIRRSFGVRYNPEHVRVILNKRLGWTSQKPERRARERDEAEIERWKGEEFPRIKKTPKRGGRPSSSRTNRALC
jgi:transposase